ncbi:MAG: HetP family heterocyst commitment protein [Synechococcales bacterium]|nr:HetP family heterocyst commitment protein [Synechococcales bacterium]
MASNFLRGNSAHQDTVKAMSTDQFEQIVKAISEGKYSWACVLILRFNGHNPAHYIPYRTYKRLIKDHKAAQKREQATFTQMGLSRDRVLKS